MYWKCDSIGVDTGNNIERIRNCNECQYNDQNEEIECTKCGDDYILKDDDIKNCYLKSDYNNNQYYYLDDYHIKKCSKEINYCKNCEKNDADVIICTECENNYRLSENDHLCYAPISNCIRYDANENCEQCHTAFAFADDDYTQCHDKFLLREIYFTTDNNNNNYYKCDNTNKGGIANCYKCEYNGQLTCNQCSNDYVLKLEINNECFLKSDINNEKTYYYLNDYQVKKCSDELTNCAKCEKNENSILNCIECDNSYYLIKDENVYCISSSDNKITSNEYYLKDNIYYSCLLHNTVNNCYKCDNENSCNLCINGYTFISDDKDICKNITELGNHYIQDEDNTIYRKCDYYMENCDTCNSKDECLTCKKNYGLHNDKKTCINIEEHNYYKDINDGYYYPCNNSINNCEKCTSNNKCIKCVDDFIRKDKNYEECVPVGDIDEEKYYRDPKDNNMYLSCSNFVYDCVKCDYPNKCNECKEDFIFLNGNYKICYNKTKTNLKTFFSDDNITYYDCNDYKYKNNIKCFSIIPKQTIKLEFVQTQIINKKLFCFMLTHSPLPKDFSIKLKINVYSSKRLRFLNTGERDIVLTTPDDSNGRENELIGFTSSDEYHNEEVQIKQITFNNDDSVTNTVTSNNICTLRFDGTSDLVDTGKVKSMIAAKKIPDCSSYQNMDIVNLNMDIIDGCEFSLYSDEEVSFANDNLDIELVEYNNTEKIIKAECDTKKNNVKTINCKVNDEIDNNYSFKDRIISDSNKFITLSSDKDKFNILCEKNNTRIWVIIIICVAVVIVIAAVIITVVICYKRKKKARLLKKLNEFDKNNSSGLNAKYHKHRKKSLAMDNKMETNGKFEMDDNNNLEGEKINVKKNKRRNSRRNSRKTTKKTK